MAQLREHSTAATYRKGPRGPAGGCWQTHAARHDLCPPPTHQQCRQQVPQRGRLHRRWW